MRMERDYEAYFDDYNCLKVYMSKNFFNGSSRIFHLKDSCDRIIHLNIDHKQDLLNGYTKYVLSLKEPLIMGEEYVFYDLRGVQWLILSLWLCPFHSRYRLSCCHLW